MHIDIQARQLVLTTTLTDAVRREAHALGSRLGPRHLRLQVRLFDVNGTRGGLDKGCLVAARAGRGRRMLVASSLDTDLYRAIREAFDKLNRGVRGTIGRARTLRRKETPGPTGGSLARVL
jgi:ribosome-associated translation inhibitor RaiA